MCPETQAPLRREGGFALVSAIFLIVVLAGLSAVMALVTSTQHQTAAQDLLGTRAFQAAQAGLEAGGYAALRGNSCANQNVSLSGALGGYTVTVGCERFTATEGAETVTLYRITATSCNAPAGGACPNPSPPGPSYVERELAMTVEG